MRDVLLCTILLVQRNSEGMDAQSVARVKLHCYEFLNSDMTNLARTSDAIGGNLVLSYWSKVVLCWWDERMIGYIY